VRRGFRTTTLTFEEITEVSAENVDKVTYDEDFLIIRGCGDEFIAVGELDDGFRDLEMALSARLDGFRSQWSEKRETLASGVREQVWRKDDDLR
jgi:hypothetical protein